MSTLRSRLIRLAHQQPHLRPHLLPLLKVATVDHLAVLKQPRSFQPVYEGNAVAIPLEWGTQGNLTPYNAAAPFVQLYSKAKRGVAFVLDDNQVLTRGGIGPLERAVASRIVSAYGEQADYESESNQGAPPDRVSHRAERQFIYLGGHLKVKIDPVVSPSTGKRGLKVVFSVPYEALDRLG